MGKFDYGTYSVQGYTSAVATVKSSATLATAHTGGLGSSLPGFNTYTLDSGVHYIFNGATETPFPAQANAGARAIYAGKLTINAGTSINKTLYVADTLTLNTGHLTHPTSRQPCYYFGPGHCRRPVQPIKTYCYCSGS